MLVESDGPIESIEISSDWFGEPMHLIGDAMTQLRNTYWIFNHRSEFNVRFLFYCEGHKLNSDAGLKQQQRLFKTGLKLQGEACKQVTQWLPVLPLAGDRCDLALEAGELNGRPALFLERSWRMHGELKGQTFLCLHTVVDAIGDGTLVCELTYQAPEEKYVSFLALAKAITNSIVWRPTNSDGDWKEAFKYGMYVNGKNVDGRHQGDRGITLEEWTSENFPALSR